MLFSRGGASLVTRLVDAGHDVFLDLKLHDIPHQVAETVRVLGDLGASLLTLHASGGTEMMAEAARAARGTGTALLGVTVLTSLDGPALRAPGIEITPAALVAARARLAVDAGLDGVVASPLEARELRELLGPTAEIVTPGIRPAGAATGDQKRVATPAEAIRAGASRLVVGRPILRASDPAGAARAILAEIAAA